MSRKLLGVLVALAAAVAALGFYWPFGTRSRALSLPGVVEIQEVRLGSKLGGRVAEILVAEGDTVEANTPLVRFDVPEVRAQRDQWLARLGQAQAELAKAVAGPREEEKEAARATVLAARQRYERVRRGWREEELRQAASELESAEADVRLSRQEFERLDELRRQNSRAVTSSEYDAARAARDRALGRYQAAKARNDMLHTGSRPEDIAEAEQEWKRAEANLRLLEAGTRKEDLEAARQRVTEAEARLREIDISLKEAVVVAPERVSIQVLAVRPGDLVPPNQPVIRALRASDLWVKVYVPETELAKLRVGQGARVTIDGLGDREFTGTVFHISSISEFTPRNVQSAEERRYQVFGVKVRVADAEGVLKAGIAAQVLFDF
jgi:multidrug resistance efflux pump